MLPESRSHTANDPASHSVLDQVLDRGDVWQARRQPEFARKQVSSGFPELDAQLPGGGWQAGQLCEIYQQGLGTGELSLILPALAKLSQQPRWILWVAPPAIPYAPTLSQAGVNLKHILVVRPKSYKEAIWCLEEGLRSGHCSAVLGWLGEWHKQHIRRLQIAAADADSHCWVWPQTGFDASGSPAALRLGVQRLSARQLQVQCFKRRGSWPGKDFIVDITQASGTPMPANDRFPAHKAVRLPSVARLGSAN
ncbi:translesion DNA synthesis-associated protein ImuA [Oceanobacter kriegii]|uniref:translesion DNA synthesis-associated protein ImuA n=1 Tax=Oceanobacter kriegii TaxID=64972 RepID=UPI0003F928C3|nr:translesion DNA synthesis-associated protein ImuA [Oceanobacter kriegii]